jgi:hypothetical protein
MQFLYEIQQFWACAGTNKRAAGPATGFRKLRMFAAEASSKRTKITGRFGSTGSSHGIPPNLKGIMTQNVTIRNEICCPGDGFPPDIAVRGNQFSLRWVLAEGFEASAFVPFNPADLNSP